ncbi:MAG: hypothetical protein HY868_18635 [Chloroflexi bacterium]|nr:hypothetical protein [Chloroflexota bacterium]
MFALGCFFAFAFFRFGTEVAAVPFGDEFEHTFGQHAGETVFVFGEFGDGKDFDAQVGAKEGFVNAGIATTACHAIKLVDDDGIELFEPCIAHHVLKSRTIIISAGKRFVFVETDERAAEIAFLLGNP